jgi:hypothetical protein
LQVGERGIDPEPGKEQQMLDPSERLDDKALDDQEFLENPEVRSAMHRP